MDLVQIRWQQVRLAETSQVILRENIELKQKIAQLQIAKTAAKQQPKASVDTKVLDHVQSLVVEYTKDYMKRIDVIKQDVQVQLNIAHQYLSTFKVVCNRYEVLLANKDVEMADTLRENDELKALIESLNQKLTERDANKQDEYAMLERKIERLIKDVDNLTTQNNELQTSVVSKTDEIASLKAKKDKLEEALKASYTTNEALQADLARSENEAKGKLAEAEDIRKKLTINYENMIEDMSADNGFLRNTIGELEEQIAKLSNSLVGNKSHFAKYVEVKSENIMLQSKLESLAPKTKANNFLPQLASGGIAATNKDGGGSSQPSSGRHGSSDHIKIPGKVIPNLPIDRNSNNAHGGGGSAGVNRTSISSGSAAISPRTHGIVPHSGRGQHGSGQGSSAKSAHEGLVLSARSHEQLESAASSQQKRPSLHTQHQQPHNNHSNNSSNPSHHHPTAPVTFVAAAVKGGHDKMSI